MRSRKPKTTPVAPGIVMHFDGHDLFIIVNGVKIAKRGHSNTPEARTWISLDPRFKGYGDDWSYEGHRPSEEKKSGSG
jgi:hypothetical protein